MKGLKKCFIFSGILMVVSLVYCLAISSVNVHALKYSYTSYPIYQTRMYDSSGNNFYSTSNPTFSFWFDGAVSFKNSLFSDSYKYSRLLDTDDVCSDTSSSSIFTTSGSDSYTSIWSGEGYGFYRTFNKVECQYNITKYSYDSILGATYDVSDGDATQLVSVNDLFFDTSSPNYDSGSIKRIDVPLNISHDHVGTLPANSPVVFNFGLLTQGSAGFPYFDSNLNYELSLQYFDSSDNPISATASCSLDSNYGLGIETDQYLVTIPYTGFNITCSYTPTTTMDYVSAQLKIWGSGYDYNPSVFLTYDYNGIWFSGSYLITENDSTWSGLSANDNPTGEDLTSMPGYSQLYPSSGGSCQPGDFTCELSNLFSFDFLNPFAPLFIMFGDNSECASIPIIAGMLGATETTYCPWFSSDIRNVLTPVLGLASMMLIFGFAVRWLGSSSGNMFEDSSREEVSNQGGRWGHFRKGK